MNGSDLLARITFNPDSFGGKPIIRGRRLAVEHALGMLAAAALRLAANALHRSDSALGAFLRRKKAHLGAHLGAPKAITATAHKLARLIYTMLRYGQEYVDAGAEYYNDSISGGLCVRPISSQLQRLPQPWT